MPFGLGGSDVQGIGNAGAGAGGAGLSDAQMGMVQIGFQLAVSILGSLGQKPFRPGYRMVGPGVWGYKAPEPVSTLNPSGMQFYSAQQFALYDDAGGSVSHNPSTIIFNPFLIHKYRAQMLAGEPDANFTWGTGTFGSYQQAITDLNALGSGGNWDVMYRVTKPETPEQTADRLMSQGPFCIWRSANTGKWMAQVYPVAGTIPANSVFVDSDFQNVKWSLQRDVIDTPGPSKTLIEDCANEVHLRWRLFAPTGALTKDTWVSPIDSDDGDGVQDEGGTGKLIQLMYESFSTLGVRSSVQIGCDQITHKQQAKVLRNFTAKRLYRPRVVVQFTTWAKAETIEPNMVTYLDDDWGERFGQPLYPGQYGNQNRWSAIPFRVAQVETELSSEGDITALTLEEVL